MQESIPLLKAIIKQRSIKSTEEIEHMHDAASLTANMHRRVIQGARPGMKESDLVAIAEEYRWSQGVDWAFPPILTTEGEVLHNHYYGLTLTEGGMVLFDGGLNNHSGYAGDMTRTFPVSNHFSSLQRSLYDTVHRAHTRAVDMVAPGVRFLDIHLAASRVLVDGLKDVGFMKGNTDDAVAAGAHTLFFQCGLGHMIGLDVHDMENLGEPLVGYTDTLAKSTAFGLKSLRLGKELEPGYGITIEPGIYVIPHLIQMRKAEGAYADYIDYTFTEKHADAGGIRIEDDYIVTSEGAQLLGEPLERSADEIEALRS